MSFFLIILIYFKDLTIKVSYQDINNFKQKLNKIINKNESRDSKILGLHKRLKSRYKSQILMENQQGKETLVQKVKTR